MSETTKQLFTENSSMAKELQLQTNETERLKAKKLFLEEDNKRLQMETELQEESVKQYAQLQQERRRKATSFQFILILKIKQLKERVHELEEELAAKNEENRKHLIKVTTKLKKELEDSQMDTEGLRKLVEIKTKETKKIRRLARNVLEQRTELEQFFLDALAEVKNEISKKKEAGLEVSF
jgi:hypothetical protein